MRAPAVIALAVGAAACAPETPAQPTWLADVRSIVASNCIRCHGAPALGGAPSTFRLDVLEDDRTDPARIVFGARSMAPFMAARAAELGDMPARGPVLSGRQKDIFAAWAKAPETGTADGNHAPVIDSLSSGACDQTCVVSVDVSDADRDVVRGRLVARREPDPEVLIGELHGGHQDLVWNVAGLAAGSYTVTASVDDDETAPAVTTEATATLARAVPGLKFVSPVADQIFLADKERLTIELVLTQLPDRFSLALRHGGAAVDIPIAAHPGINIVNVDLTNVEACTLEAACRSYAVVATYSDAADKPDVVVTSPPFIVSRESSDSYEGSTQVRSVVAGVCQRCHDGVAAQDGGLFPAGPDFRTDLTTLRRMRGLAFRKVWQLREMPPVSRDVLIDPPPTFTEDDRQKLARWLLAGAP